MICVFVFMSSHHKYCQNLCQQWWKHFIWPYQDNSFWHQVINCHWLTHWPLGDLNEDLDYCGTCNQSWTKQSICCILHRWIPLYRNKFKQHHFNKHKFITVICIYIAMYKEQWSMWPLLELLSWCPILSHCKSFEDQAPVDEIYGCLIFKWVAMTWLHDTGW